MKNLKLLLLSLISLMVIASSCDKTGDVPTPGGGDTDNTILWSFPIAQASAVDDILPAVDDQDNIYLSVPNWEEGNVMVYSVDKDGNERWSVALEGTNTSKVTYADGQVFVPMSTPASVYALNASTGSVNWSKDLAAQYDFDGIPALAWANSRLYVASGQLFDGFLLAYDASGTELWVESTGFEPGINLTVNGSSLFTSNYDFLLRFDDEGNSARKIWSAYYYPESKGNPLISGSDLPVHNGNIYIRTADSMKIYSYDGMLVNRFAFDFGDNPMNYSNITLNSTGDIFFGNGDLQKYSTSGALVWQSDIHDGFFVNPSFNSAPVIASTGYMYDAQLFGLYSVSPEGTLNWKINAETNTSTEYGNLHIPVLLHNGNIISVSSEQAYVRCFKGDGAGLDTGGWPKVGGDYANTSSK